MKPLYFQIPKISSETIRVQYESTNHFYANLHFHPEVQIMFIIESSGTRFIGDNIGSFSAGDIFLLGSNLPHLFRNDKKYYSNDPDLQAKGISIFFDTGMLGENIFLLPEMHSIKKLIADSKRGISVNGNTKEKVALMVEDMLHMEGFNRIIQVLNILNLLSNSKEMEIISSAGFTSTQKDSDNKKINDVFTYIMNNFSAEVKLQEAANIANMSVNAFCRYFKQHTRKTFSHFLNEVRIGHACRLLIEDKWNIRETAFDCGYDNISYFNRQFKEITGYTPTDYIKLHRESFSVHLM